MDETKRNVGVNDLAEIHALGRWTRRYVHSRSLPVLASLVVFGVLMVLLLMLWSAAGDAYRSGNAFLLVVCGFGLIIAHVVLAWLSVPRWGGKWLQHWAWRYYDREGEVTPKMSLPQKRMQFMGGSVAVVFGVCILGHVALKLAGVVGEELILPIQALYVVPFLTFLFVAMRAYTMLLYPILYGAHAAVVAFGQPDPLIRFVPPEFSSFAAIILYGAIAVLMSHIYNRIALSRMSHHGRVESK